MNGLFGPPDILVHAAGVNLREPAENVTRESWQETQWLNLSAPFFISRQFVPHMKSQGWGRIVNFASLQTTRAFPSGIAYGASKAGVGQLTRAMAEEWSSDGVNVNAIGPGFFPTELGARFRRSRTFGPQRGADASGARRLDDIDGRYCSSAWRVGLCHGAGSHGRWGSRRNEGTCHTGTEASEIRDVEAPVAGAGGSLVDISLRHMRVRHTCLARP